MKNRDLWLAMLVAAALAALREAARRQPPSKS
jgi:hypothetical protein